MSQAQTHQVSILFTWLGLLALRWLVRASLIVHMFWFNTQLYDSDVFACQLAWSAV